MKSWTLLVLIAAAGSLGIARWGASTTGQSHLASQREGHSVSELRPELQTMFGQIDRAQQIPQVMAQGPQADAQREAQRVPLPPRRPVNLTAADGNLGCSNCSQRVTDLRYMRCDRRNSYLESEMQQLGARSTLVADLLRRGPRGDSIIKPVCVKASLETRIGPSSMSFRSCSTGASHRAYRPCVSENYFALVHNSFDLVSRCMAPLLGSTKAQQTASVRTIYGLFTVESGMHVNAGSGTGAAGMGQLTSDAIHAVNRNELGDLREHLRKQGGQCAVLSREFLSGATPMNSSRARSCERTSVLKGNPVLNMIYSYALLVENREEVTKDILNSRYTSGKFALSADAREKLKVALTAWAHNTGLAGLKTPLMALLHSHYRGRQVTDVNAFLHQLSSAMQTYPHRANSGRSRRKETSSYWPHIEAALNQIESNAGGGSCAAH